MASIVGPQSAGITLDAIVQKFETSALTINIKPDLLDNLMGDSVMNTWESSGQARDPDYMRTRDENESHLFHYQHSSIPDIAKHASSPNATLFMPQYRPTYGAVDFNPDIGVSTPDGVELGGAPFYGDTVLVLNSAQTGFITLSVVVATLSSRGVVRC